MQKTTLYITRHGQTEWNVQKRMQGYQDSPLTSLGETQAEWLYESLKNIEFGATYSSSSLRAFRTAEIITGNQTGKIVTSDQLREMSFGEWEGQTEEDIQTYDADRYEAFWKAPHLYVPNKGESYADVQSRVIEKVNEIIHNHSGTNILIVTHTVVIKMLMSYYEGRALSDLWNPPYIHPTCLCKVEIVDDKPIICLHGDTSHYKQIITESY